MLHKPLIAVLHQKQNIKKLMQLAAVYRAVLDCERNEDYNVIVKVISTMLICFFCRHFYRQKWYSDFWTKVRFSEENV